MPDEQAIMELPEGLLLSFYGDDFTGSTDVMESLALSGLRTILFLKPPSPEQLSKFEGIRAVGVAGISRSLPTDEMSAELSPVFLALKQLNAPFVHYKICSTFDSSPQVGSIGLAIEVGRSIINSSMTPVLVGAPALGRYQAFGNLFARSGGDSDVYRLDRHPTMRRHPVTPMIEADLRVHLARQTDLLIGLFDVRQLSLPYETAQENFQELARSGVKIGLIDVVDDSNLPLLGRLLWQGSKLDAPAFVAGSSGVESALTACWREAGLIPPPAPRPTFVPSSPLLVISGSCSPVTERQIAHALDHGFREIALDPIPMMVEGSADCEAEAVGLLESGQSVVMHLSRGPDDPRRIDMLHFLERANNVRRGSAELGRILGRLLSRILSKSNVGRVVIAGGDTSGFVARELGIEALEMIAPVAPGSPLCQATSKNSRINGLEIMFKGGQVGKDDLFSAIRQGTQNNSV